MSNKGGFDYTELKGSYDKEHNAIVTLPSPQKRIHNGRVFSATHLFSGVADTNSVELPFITGSKDVKYLSRVKSDGQCEIEFEKGTTFTDKGTEIPLINRNETSSNTTTVKVYYAPTIDTAGTVFSQDFIPSSTAKFSTQGGETSVDVRYVIKANTNHLLRITNTSGSSGKIFVKGIWVE